MGSFVISEVIMKPSYSNVWFN